MPRAGKVEVALGRLERALSRLEEVSGTRAMAEATADADATAVVETLREDLAASRADFERLEVTARTVSDRLDGAIDHIKVLLEE